MRNCLLNGGFVTSLHLAQSFDRVDFRLVVNLFVVLGAEINQVCVTIVFPGWQVFASPWPVRRLANDVCNLPCNNWPLHRSYMLHKRIPAAWKRTSVSGQQ